MTNRPFLPKAPFYSPKNSVIKVLVCVTLFEAVKSLPNAPTLPYSVSKEYLILLILLFSILYKS